MSLLKTIKAQLGLSNTPANNFTITAEAANGTLKLARGNAGATTQDILTVDASGNVLVDGNNLNLFSAKSLAHSGYQKLPSGLIIQWGRRTIGDPNGDYFGTIYFPIAFPNSTFLVNVALYSYAGNAFDASAAVTVQALTGFDFTVQEWSGINQSIDVVYIAIGY